MKKSLLAILFLTAVIFGIADHGKQEPETGNPVHVILLGGQSNMVGLANFENLNDAMIRRIEAASDRVSVSISGHKPVPLSEAYGLPISKKFSFKKAFGPEMSLGVTMAEANPNQDYLLVKTAYGGTSLYGAWNPKWSRDKALRIEAGNIRQKNKFFKLLVSHTHKNLIQLKQRGRSPRIIGLIWMQGERDAQRKFAALSYRSNLEKLIKGFRKEFEIPNMPVVVGQINSIRGDFEEGPGIVRAAIREVSDADPDTSMIETSMDNSWSDYPKHFDAVHYNEDGQQRLGKAFAAELIKLRGSVE